MKTFCNVYDKTTDEREEFYTLTEAKKWMRDRIRQGHEVTGSKTRVWADGEWEVMGPIELSTNNRVLVANTRMTKAGY